MIKEFSMKRRSMPKQPSETISVENILNSLSDHKSLILFKAIANNDSTTPIERTGLSRKQFYSRLYNLKQAGLIKRTQGKYSLTASGKIVYYALKTIESVCNNYWKLKAVDSIDHKLPENEYVRIVNTLIDSQNIRDIILASLKDDNRSIMAKKNRVFMVDDDVYINSIFKTHLEDAGFIVDSFTDPDFAFENFKADFYNLLLLDIKMPKINGFDLYKQIREIDNKVKVLFITEFEEYYEKFKNTFPYLDEKECFIRKPIEGGLLIKQVKKIIS
jgi:CheY-like chemotaxis protein